MKSLFEQRLKFSVSNFNEQWGSLWSRASVGTVNGSQVLDFLIDGSLMRPRYLIRLFETARRRALTFGRNKIVEDDYIYALSELGWQVFEDLDREIADLVPNGADLLFEVFQQREGLTASKFRYIAKRKMGNDKNVEKLLDVMLWNGSLGVMERGSPMYIFDTGYKRQYLIALVNANEDVTLVMHSTLVAALG